MPRSLEQKLRDAGLDEHNHDTVKLIVGQTRMTVSNIKPTFDEEKLETIRNLLDTIEDQTNEIEVRTSALEKLRNLLGKDADNMAPNDVVEAVGSS